MLTTTALARLIQCPTEYRNGLLATDAGAIVGITEPVRVEDAIGKQGPTVGVMEMAPTAYDVNGVCMVRLDAEQAAMYRKEGYYIAPLM